MIRHFVVPDARLRSLLQPAPAVGCRATRPANQATIAASVSRCVARAGSEALQYSKRKEVTVGVGRPL